MGPTLAPADALRRASGGASPLQLVRGRGRHPLNEALLGRRILDHGAHIAEIKYE